MVQRYDVMPQNDVVIFASSQLWRHGFRAVFITVSRPQKMILFLLCGYLSKVKTFADCLNIPCEVYSGLILEYSLSHDFPFHKAIYKFSNVTHVT